MKRAARPPSDFSGPEHDALRASNLAVFEGRLVLNARPPIPKRSLAALAKVAAQPLPDDLIALWSTSFGGELAYDLRVDFGGQLTRLSCRELFYPKSGAYKDLWGWIKNEQAVQGDDSALSWLPIGGFEYLDRIYVGVGSEPGYGTVLAWTKGLPPAWRFRLHEDASAEVAPCVRGLFRSLCLEEDPWVRPEATGAPMLEAIRAVAACGPSGKTAAEKLEALVRGAILDWRSALADGTVASQPVLRRLGLEQAARQDDVDALERFSDLGVDLSESLVQGLGALEHALLTRSMGAAKFLMQRNVRATNALLASASFADVELARELLARGARLDARAILDAAEAGNLASANLMLGAARAHRVHFPELIELARARATSAENMIVAIESGTTRSNVSAADLRAQVGALRELADAAETALRSYLNG